MNFDFEEQKISVNTNLRNQTIEIITEMSNRKIVETMNLKDEMTRKALIDLGWTPPWNYSMNEAPKDGRMLLLKIKSYFEGDESRTCQGSWRVDEGFSGNNNPLWLEDSYDDWSTGYASTPLNPIAWKPIVD